MTILFTGKTDFKYNRVRVLVAGLEKTDGVRLLFFPIISRSRFDKHKFLALEATADFIYIPPFRHRDVAFIKKFSTKPVVFDPLISKYLTKVDFGHFWKLPFKYFLDKIPFTKGDVLLADTACHKKYFSETFSIAPSKIHVLPIGVDTAAFEKTEKQQKSTVFTVGFYGSFVPLQGTTTIVEVARLLHDRADIRFELIGSGYRFKEATTLAKKYNLQNISFPGSVAYDKLGERIGRFDVCLGIFGGSAKADYVIPNKVYHYAAVGKCILTKESDGIKELFTNSKDIIFTSTAPEDIAKKIVMLKDNPRMVEHVAENAYRLIHEHYNEREIAKKFLAILADYSKSIGK
jgi:glycosyltransferase involved in cell wall biosynthesis